jgi:diguanylate cyclase (GGDEF)-like protein
VGGNTIQITLSIGIAGTAYGHSVLDFSALLKSADQAMYQSKQTGRNKVSTL